MIPERKQIVHIWGRRGIIPLWKSYLIYRRFSDSAINGRGRCHTPQQMSIWSSLFLAGSSVVSEIVLFRSLILFFPLEIGYTTCYRFKM